MLLNFFYNLFFPLVFLFFLPGLVVKLIRRPGRKKNYPERFAIFSREKKERLKALDHPVWMHAVSVGETNLALTALQAWKKIDPERRFVLSTTTTTAQEIARTLCNPALTITEAAEALGFSSVSYFSRFTTRCLGVSPKAFRQSKAE